MPQTCTICRHTDREAIDTAVAHQTPLRTIADQHGVSKTALLRHKQHGIGPSGSMAPRVQDWKALALEAHRLHQQALRAHDIVTMVLTLRTTTALLVRLCDRGALPPDGTSRTEEVASEA